LTAPLDIVLLQCGLSHLTVRCIESIHDTYPAGRIILIDNGSSEEHIYAAETELAPGDTLIRNRSNLGFAKAVNQGLRASDAPFVAVQNNDTVVTAGAFERMLTTLGRQPEIGLIGPLTNNADTGQRSRPGEVAPAGQFVYTDGLVAFFCAVLRRTAYLQVGDLDEQFGMGYGEDDDYCIRLRRAGWRLAIARDAYVHHDHHQTYLTTIGQEGIDAEGQQGLDRLMEKYGSYTG